MCESCRRCRVRQIVSRDIHSLEAGNRTVLGRGDAFLQIAHLGSQSRLITDRAWGTAQECGYLDPTIDLGWVDNGEIPDTGEMLDAGDAGEMSDTDDTGDTCGDFAVQVDEECDGWNTNFESCLSLGFVKGQLACNDDCTFDVGGCVEVGCGNGVIDTAEMCDGSPYPCWVLGFAGSTAPDGMTPCNADCTPSESTCLAACEWGQPGCFCEETTPCTEGYIVLAFQHPVTEVHREIRKCQIQLLSFVGRLKYTN
jgi:hypothetical protein